jgi:uncharacterized membrane protein YdjX (TVP38/TMEM64 family)|tara:strand:+ start:581 stop:1123 length:543 start_codon:yes stop_codon:yes gene_type:complete
MEEVINTLLSFSNDNILLISLMFILLSNLVVPGSLIIIFYITTLGFFKGILASYLVLTIAVCIPYLLINLGKLNYEKYLNNEAQFIRKRIVNENPNKSILFIRFTFIPFVVQNILCSLVAVSFLRFITLNLIGLTPSILLIAFFTESILQLRTNLLLISISLFLILGFFFHKSYKSYMRN